MTGTVDPLFTIGHGTSSQDEILALLEQAQVRALVDIRRFPGSRAHPHVSTDAMARWLPDAGIAYRREHTRTEEFTAGLDELLEQAAGEAVAVLCSETVYAAYARNASTVHQVSGDTVSFGSLRRPPSR